MKGSMPIRGLALAFTTAALSACGGAPGSTPPVASALAQHAASSARPSGYLPDCSTPEAKVPGTYIMLASEGDVTRGSSYADNFGTWYEGKVVPTSSPSPAPSTGPHPKEPAQAAFVYYGRYNLAKTKQIGCAYLVTSVSGKKLIGSDNATLQALPNLSSDFISFVPTKGGRLIVTADHLTASGGAGTMILKTSGGGTYDTGVIRFIGRLRRSDAVAAKSAPIGERVMRRPHYAFDCSGKGYIAGVAWVSPGREQSIAFVVNTPFPESHWFRPEFSFCGIEGSNVNDHVKSAIKWAKNAEGYTWTITATFDPAYDWANHPRVAVWSSAWFLDFIPAHDFNKTLKLDLVK
jgi:hypothetical protein